MKFMLKYVGAALLAAVATQAGAATYVETFGNSTVMNYATTATGGAFGTWLEAGSGSANIVYDPLPVSGASNYSLYLVGGTTLTYTFTLASASTVELSFLEGNDSNSNITLLSNGNYVDSDDSSTSGFSQYPVGGGSVTFNMQSGPNVLTFVHSGSGKFWIDDMTLSVTAVPEPETYAMMLAGLGAIGFMARRRRVG